ncbi:uncharacterized protein LOC141905809 [Tubulanus polymorphus]|uniref:uncharacterized protein LOC141905809 n=1 Tax=Tubulanus polymorphus TaxID=672921 RepID=UPI003DA5CA46
MNSPSPPPSDSETAVEDNTSEDVVIEPTEPEGDEWASSPRDEWASSPGDEWTSSPGDEWTSSPGDEWTSSPGDEWTSSPGDEWTSSPGDEWTSSPGEDELNIGDLCLVSDLIHERNAIQFTSTKYAKPSDTERLNDHRATSRSRDQSKQLNSIDQFDDCRPVIDLNSIYNYEVDCDTDILHISQIPTEIMLKILMYLTLVELCLNVAPVCKYWYQFAYSPCLWKSLNSNRVVRCMSINTLIRITRCAPFLKRLNLRGRNLNSNDIQMVTAAIPELTDLNLGFCDQLDADMLRLIAVNCRDLNALNVEGCSTVNENCVHIITTMMRQLNSLNLSHCTGLSDIDILQIAEHCDKLLRLNIDGIAWITDDCVTTVVCLHRYNLTHLTLDGAELTDDCMRFVSKCLNLVELCVCFAELLTDKSLVYLTDLRNLRELQLRKGVEFTVAGLKRAFDCGTWKYLTALDLSECTQVDDNVMISIVKCCGALLLKLCLCWCWNITDIGLVTIVDHCSNIQRLDLLGIHLITGVCLQRIPQELIHLSYLNLQNCNQIQDELIVNVLRSLNNRQLTVINYYGEHFERYHSDD